MDFPENGKDFFLKNFPVPRETIHRLEGYVAALTETNQKINLISQNTLPQIWTRHIADSAQLINHIPEGTQKIIDMGSGAGFPGLVLAILRPEVEVNLIESTGKKANFLSEIAKEFAPNAIIHNGRIEQYEDLKGEVITARALASVRDLLNYSHKLRQAKSICLFMKGEKVDQEIMDAKKYWQFKCDPISSMTNPASHILKLAEISRMRKHKQ